jgi:hypothetical protein
MRAYEVLSALGALALFGCSSAATDEVTDTTGAVYEVYCDESSCDQDLAATPPCGTNMALLPERHLLVCPTDGDYVNYLNCRAVSCFEENDCPLSRYTCQEGYCIDGAVSELTPADMSARCLSTLPVRDFCYFKGDDPLTAGDLDPRLTVLASALETYCPSGTTCSALAPECN